MGQPRGKDQEKDVLRGHDERNVAALNFIPVQERLPEDLLRLERMVIRTNGQPAKIVCTGVPGIGMARGSDNDLLVALINVYIDAGCPADGIITTSAYALLKLSGQGTSGKHYQALSQCLARVFNTTYHITDGWFDFHAKRYTTVSFRIIDSLTRTHREETGADITLDSRSVLRIRLSEEITKSIRNGYIKPLNLTDYQSLPTVGSRTLYRLLDMYLDEAATRGDPKPYRMAVSLMTHAQNCGVLNRRPDHVRRALDSMHEPLIKMGYLATVNYVGKGLKTTVHYTYGETTSPINQEHVALLVKHGVHRGVAEKYARNLGEKVVVVVAKFAEELKRPNKKIENPAAYLVSLLKDVDSIVAQTRSDELRKQDIQRTRKASQAKIVKAEAQQNHLFEEELHLAIQKEGPEAAVEFMLTSFKVRQLQRHGLELHEIDQVRNAVLERRVDAAQMHAILNRVLMSPEVGIRDLRALL
ncbi:replication initiator protein A [Deinococcus hopiensis]|uniref:Plasmid replication initiator protein n=1 Tax=Deinococcus hopiensis KR-140 TaxID=695939 RepID=A0A1W1USS3_9DEIO|nr:replication initiator protein A [Deinococcus hopiensis]SMB84147.1 Plasmid replication initiator protein [Deinococcus hopiensis KR-140]